jgi:hypothetical protein
MSSVPAQRLLAQQIGCPALGAPAEVVGHLGAVQAQDYAAARWAVGLRLREGAASDAVIERALTEGTVLRTHALRWTWQLVTPADVRWMQALVAPRLFARAAARHRELGLDAATLRRSRAVLERALRDGAHLTRAELAAALEAKGVSASGPRLSHLLAVAELEGLICSGARRGRQSTHALLDQRAPGGRSLAREEALAELAGRYLRSRGPATLADFVWWSGLTVAEARVGLEAIKHTLVCELVDGQAHYRADQAPVACPAHTAWLLPAFDEYLVAYRVRDAALDPRQARRYNAGGGMLNPCVVVDGRVTGTWRRTLARGVVRIELDLFDRPKAWELRAVGVAARRYAEFLGLDVTVTPGPAGRRSR